jgi:hypothetical protein
METLWSIINAFLYPLIAIAKIIGTLLIIAYLVIGAYIAYKCHAVWHEAIMEPEDYPRLRWIFFPIKTFRGEFGITGNWYGEERPSFYWFLALCTIFWPIKILISLCLAAVLYPIFKHKQRKKS